LEPPTNPERFTEVADIGTERAVPKDKISSAVDPQTIQLLRSLRRAGWVIAWLLALILIVLLLRR
jgi:hypothetical protein